jgi:transcription initiation factor IIE alpha subunit
MMRMSKLNISENFTIEDIHKIREYNYERRKNMTDKEYAEDVNKGAEKGRKRIAELRRKAVAI